MKLKTSALTLVKGRVKALENLIAGLCHNHILPDELIIVLINESPRKLPNTPFPVRQISLNGEHELPLAAARNMAAKSAAGDLLIFLDVDCIPAPDLISRYLNETKVGMLANGDVRYLTKGATEQPEFEMRLDELSAVDPVRYGIKNLPHELFWSLNFACYKVDFNRIGGFDETFVGYGAEDTDFAFTARLCNIGMSIVAATAYHQYHEQFSPPLNHFSDVIKNADVFFAKWQIWPMEGWLRAFNELRLINWNEKTLSIIRPPSAIEIANAMRH